jgi:predicted esterase/tetratricopeptide (TPR) repeat protein
MNALDRNLRRAAWAVLCAAGCMAAFPAVASEVFMKDGRILRGKLGDLVGLSDQPSVVDQGSQPKMIVFVDNELCRTFVPKHQIAEIRPDTAGSTDEKFAIRQPATAKTGSRIATVGPLLKVENFDEFGRRTVTMQTIKGQLPIIQAITEITPQWIKVESVQYIWDYRMATSALPPDVLHKILLRQINPKDVEHRKKIARFYLQSERYDKAREALQSILADFPQMTDLKQQLEPTIQQLGQLQSQRILAELKLRRTAGQHEFVQTLLKKFPAEDTPGDVLQAVRELLQEYQGLETTRAKVLKEFANLLAQVKDEDTRKRIAPMAKELNAELSPDTLGRMASFVQNLNDPQISPENKLALAISGWLVGADKSMPRLTTALSTYKIRQMVTSYLSEPVKRKRAGVISALQSEEGNSPKLVAQLLAMMKPPLELPDPVEESKPGYYKLEAPGAASQPGTTYYLQVPPEYDPHRRYPMIVTLHGIRTTAEQQIDWWAGAWGQRGRAGQATRQGYIVMAPEWAMEQQKEYEFCAREHSAVLNCLRDACRRFAVDTDRVFLSGHSMGGDAAWDMGLAHPDLWAGVIPIVAESLKYCTFYWENARYVPFYIVEGELDGSKLTRSARDLDRYFKAKRLNINVTVVEYLGRGHEHFSDELLRLFDWMGRFRRDFYPRDIECYTMRPWDNFFWWTELEGLPAAAMVDPANWSPKTNSRPVQVKATITANNNLNISARASKVTVWVSPQMVDMKQPVGVVVNSRKINGRDPFILPSLEVLLEDVRTRGDRQHPFWAKVETGK